MRTFLAAQLGLGAFALYWIALGFLGTGPAIALALAASTALLLWRARSGEVRIVEAGGAIAFAALWLLDLAAPAFVDGGAVWLSFAALGLISLVSVAVGRPWTSDYSRAAYAAESASPVFHIVNMALSGLWGVLFLLDAAAIAADLGSLVTGGLFVFGALVSIFGPRFVIRATLRRMIAAGEPNAWPAPAFSSSSSDGVDVAVVGAGIGGLVSAALLAEAGLKVEVHDAHVVPGGFCHSFLRKAHHEGRACLYRFDAGPHDFSGVFPGGPLTTVLERLGVADRIEWRRLDHAYVIDGHRIEPARDWRDYARQLGDLFPSDRDGLAALFNDIRAIWDGMYATGEGRSGIPGLPKNVDAMLAFPRKHPMAARWMDRPFGELVASHVAHESARRLINALTGYISDGRETLSCADMVPLFGYYFNGGYYPVGGSQHLADVLVEAIKARGGAVHLKSRVAKILVEGGRAVGLKLADGRRIDARAVISNADPKRTFLELLEPGELPRAFRARLAAAEPAPSAFMVHLGVDYIPEGRPARHIHDAPNIGLEILSKVDASAAPAGHSTIGLIKLISADEAKRWFPSDGGGDEWKAWRRSKDYEDRKQCVGDEMLAAAERELPRLSGHIVCRFDASPVTYARYDLSSAGAIYGVSKAGRLSGVKTPVPGLVVAGAATHGPGVEAVWISGARAAEALVPGLLDWTPKAPGIKAAA